MHTCAPSRTLSYISYRGVLVPRSWARFSSSGDIKGLGPGGPRGTRALADVARLARRSGQRLIDGLHIELYEPVCMASYLARPGTRSAFYSWRRERRAWRCLPLWRCSVSVVPPICLVTSGLAWKSAAFVELTDRSLITRCDAAASEQGAVG